MKKFVLSAALLFSALAGNAEYALSINEWAFSPGKSERKTQCGWYRGNIKYPVPEQ